MSSTSSTVCHQGLKSCLEPLVCLKLNPPGSNFHSEYEEKTSHIEKIDNLNLVNKKDNKEVEVACWSFLQSLANPNQTAKSDSEAEKVYVHPLAKRSASVLNPRSLEMCTENLGSETGSENGGDNLSLLLSNKIESPLFSIESSGEVNPNPRCSATTITTSESAKILSDNIVQATPKRLKRGSATTTNFPPPLTSISGSNGVQMTPHREGGRLVLKAVTVVSPPTAYFQAERGDGRLRLTLLKNFSSPECDIVEHVGVEEVEEDDEVQIKAKNEENGGEVEAEEIDGKVESVETEEMEGDIEGVEIEVEGKNEQVIENEDMEGNCENVGDEKGMEKKLPRPSRCKEGGRGNKKMVMNWPESFWVAT